MKIKKIVGNNFMQYKHFELDVENQGLCLINGEVEDSSFSLSNTSGKTTLIVHSFCWGIFGETLSKLKSNDVINDDEGKNCYIKILAEDGGIEYSVIRYRKHKVYKNELRFLKGDQNPDELNNEDDITKSSIIETQKEITTIFNLDIDTITNTVIFGQGSVKRFSEFTDTERKNLLDTLLNFNILQSLTKITTESIKELNVAIDTKSLKLYNHTSSSEALSIEVEDLNTKVADFNITNNNEINTFKVEINSLKDKLNSESTTDESKINSLLNKVDKEIVNLSGSLDTEAINDKVINVKLKITEVGLNLSKAVGERGALEYTLNNINAIEECDECGTILSKEIKKNNRKNKEEQIENEAASILLLVNEKKKYRGLLQQYEQQQEASKEMEDKLAKYKEYKNDLNIKLEKAKSSKLLADEYTSSIKEKEEKINKLNKGKNPYEDLIKTKNKEINKLNKLIKEIKEEVEESQEQLKYFDFWKDGYSKKIKSLLLDNVVPFITDKTNYFLNFLTNGEIKIKFFTQSSVKSSDELRDKIDIKLFKNGKEYSIEKTSSGERRRIDICISLALQSVLTMSNKSSFNIAIYDEIFDSLDEVGVDYVIALLKEEIKNKDSIFVISHNTNLQEKFNNVLTVRKKNGISYLN